MAAHTWFTALMSATR